MLLLLCRAKIVVLTQTALQASNRNFNVFTFLCVKKCKERLNASCMPSLMQSEDMIGFDWIFGVLAPRSTIFQLYHGDQFQWWMKPERTTDHGQTTGKLYHLRMRVECTLFCILQKPNTDCCRRSLETSMFLHLCV